MPIDPSVVDGEGERRILAVVAAAWRCGWQPKELVRHVGRTTDAPTVGLALSAIAADHARRRAAFVDARWTAQLNDLGVPTTTVDRWIGRGADEHRLPRPEQLRAVVALVQCLTGIAPIPLLLPPPGSAPDDGAVIDLHTEIDDPVLDRVRALLAQAESTTFEAEAATFTAKAQELMARHAIDLAMLSAHARRSDRPATIRIAIDDPYVSAKSLLLHVVAKSSRCTAVFHSDYAMSSVVGFACDLDATQTLFTSLLVQAQVAMQAAATLAAPGTRARSRAFRSAFLMAYAHRVADRLDEINRYVVADAEATTGGSILPVLAARSAQVDAMVGELFGRLGRSRPRRGFDAAGWASGVMAADRARLNGDVGPPAGPAQPPALSNI